MAFCLYDQDAQNHRQSQSIPIIPGATIHFSVVHVIFSLYWSLDSWGPVIQNVVQLIKLIHVLLYFCLHAQWCVHRGLRCRILSLWMCLIFSWKPKITVGSGCSIPGTMLQSQTIWFDCNRYNKIGSSFEIKYAYFLWIIPFYSG